MTATTSVPRSSPPGSGNEEHPLYVDIKGLLEHGLPEPPVPSMCAREDGVGLFYAGQVNVLFGDPESGKTWLAYAAVVQALDDGLGVVVVDADHNGWQQVISRLLALGAEPDVLGDLGRFRLIEPEDRASLVAAIRDVSAWAPALAVVDSIGEILPILGLNSNSPDDYTAAHRMVLRPLAVEGVAVVAIDHLPKSAETRHAGPTGTAAKGRAVGGTSLRVTAREPFTPGKGGSAVLSIRKDRPGGLRAASPVTRPGTEAPAGVFVLTPASGESTDDLDRVTARIEVPTDGDVLTRSQVAGGSKPSDDDLAAVSGLPDDQRKVRRVKREFGWGTNRASAAIQAVKAIDADERSPFPDPGGEEHGNTFPLGVPGTFPGNAGTPEDAR